MTKTNAKNTLAVLEEELTKKQKLESFLKRFDIDVQLEMDYLVKQYVETAILARVMQGGGSL